ncbi:MAG: 4-alpha-glucanotransferase [Bacteroidota bacterium]|nr:4-alpha-glucanotransferase [Bacteroidota bacterium]
MNTERATGILLHITSLPSNHGTGDFGSAAYRFAEILKEAGVKYWQILPLNPTDAATAYSPYSSNSAFGLNSLFVDPEQLLHQGWLGKDEIAQCSKGKTGIDYQFAHACKNELFERAWVRFKINIPFDFYEFLNNNSYWIQDHALYRSLKSHFSEKSWDRWPEGIRDRKAGDLESYRNLLKDEILEEQFRQYVLFKQWMKLKSHCNDAGLKIFGDMPIYIQHDSADVWAHKEYFKLDEEKQPAFVAGVPPDYFSESGQLWGNPVYHWQAMADDHFTWWTERFRQQVDLFDLVRIDHFRAFLSYWEVEAGEETAVNGKWVKAPGVQLLGRLKQVLGPIPLVAENLGIITPDVNEFLENQKIPGMQVMQFGFQSMAPANEYLPHNFEKNCVAYTGTHDNNTSRGWYRQEINDEQRKWLSMYFGKDIGESNVAQEMIRLLIQSPAALVVFPLQDLLGQDENYRMNKPGTLLENWQYCMEWQDLPEERLNG